MDTATVPVASSIPQPPPSSNRIQPARPMHRMFLTWLGGAVGIGLLVGAVVAAGFLYIPYDRVVVRDQPVSPVIMLDSVHLSKNGWVMVYIRKPDGIQEAGLSAYLNAQYYRKITVAIDFRFLADYEGREFFVRIFHDDDGDTMLDQEKDSVVMSGTVPYQRRFHFIHPEKVVQELWGDFLDHPLLFLTDTIFP